MIKLFHKIEIRTIMPTENFIYNYDLLITENFSRKDILPLLQKTYESVFKNTDSETQSVIDIINNLDIDAILNYAKTIRKKCSAFVVFGIGGSSLGTNVIFHALKQHNYNELSRVERSAPKFYVEDNVDPEKITALLNILNLKRTIFCIVSKSGDTIETLAQFFAILEKIKSATGKSWAEHFVIITGIFFRTN